MKRKFLEELDIDKDSIDKIMAELGKDTESKKAEVESLKADLQKATEEIANRDKQLEKLKAVDPEQLQNTIKQLKAENAEVKASWEKEKKDMQFNNAIKVAISGKVQDEELVTELIARNKDKLVLNNGEVIGLDEQIKQLQEAKPFLFRTNEVKKEYTPTAGGTNNLGNPFDKNSKAFNLTEASRMFRENPEKARELAKEAGINL